MPPCPVHSGPPPGRPSPKSPPLTGKPFSTAPVHWDRCTSFQLPLPTGAGAPWTSPIHLKCSLAIHVRLSPHSHQSMGCSCLMSTVPQCPAWKGSLALPDEGGSLALKSPHPEPGTINLLTVTTALWCIYAHFIDEETEVQRDQRTCQRSHGQEAVEMQSRPFGSRALTHWLQGLPNEQRKGGKGGREGGS